MEQQLSLNTQAALSAMDRLQSAGSIIVDAAVEEEEAHAEEDQEPAVARVNAPLPLPEYGFLTAFGDCQQEALLQQQQQWLPAEKDGRMLAAAAAAAVSTQVQQGKVKQQLPLPPLSPPLHIASPESPRDAVDLLEVLSSAGLTFERDWQHVFSLTGACGCGNGYESCCW